MEKYIIFKWNFLIKRGTTMVNLNIDGCKKTYDLKNNTDGIRLSDIAKDFENNYSGYISLAVVNNDLQ